MSGIPYCGSEGGFLNFHFTKLCFGFISRGSSHRKWTLDPEPGHRSTLSYIDSKGLIRILGPNPQPYLGLVIEDTQVHV